MDNLLDNKIAPDFNDPLGLIKACHQRILGFCELLEKIQSRVSSKGVDDDVKQAAKKIHHYFSTAAILHHQDEETDLFPLLSTLSEETTAIIQELKQDHLALDEAWQQLEPLLTKPESIIESNNFSHLVKIFCSSYRNHIRKEEDDFLPLAQHMLKLEQLNNLGKKMQKRRQQS